MKPIFKTFSIVTLALLVLGADSGQSQSWTENPSAFVRWTNFTALPVIESPYNNQWIFAERQRGGDWELAAIYSGQRSNSVMMIAESTATPVFRRVGTNYPMYYSYADIGFTSVATVLWTNQYKDFSLVRD